MTELYKLFYSTLDRAEIPKLCGVFGSLNQVCSYFNSLPDTFMDNYYLYRSKCDDIIPVDTSQKYDTPVYRLAQLPGVNAMFRD